MNVEGYLEVVYPVLTYGTLPEERMLAVLSQTRRIQCRVEDAGTDPESKLRDCQIWVKGPLDKILDAVRFCNADGMSQWEFRQGRLA